MSTGERLMQDGFKIVCSMALYLAHHSLVLMLRHMNLAMALINIQVISRSESESGALDEGFADIWGACVEEWATPANRNGY